jgi:CheY-specific phosphatase CheX
MFFELLIEPPQVRALPPVELFDASRVDFEGGPHGRLIVAAPPKLSAVLASAFLALEDQTADPSSIAFVLGELANMLCGSTLGRLRPDGTFRLSAPATQLGQTRVEQAGTNCDWIRFSLDSGPLYVGIKLEVSP